MRQNGWVITALVVVIVLIAGAAILVHYPGTYQVAEHLRALHEHMGPDNEPGAMPSGQFGLDFGGDPEATAHALAGVAAIGKRWDTEAFAETVALYTDVHRDIEWPGVLEPETIHYGPDAKQTFELYRPEQGFSEPGPVFVFMHGNGLGNSDLVAPGSDGLIYSHIGKLAATFGGIGVTMNYRTDTGNGAGATLESGAEDLRLVLQWIVEHIAPDGGDPGTIVLLANSEGATRAAAYLFNEDWQMSSGPGVAAAMLSSGLFGALAPEIAESVDAYRGERVPLALWSGEFDTTEVADGIAALREQLCRKYADCPTFERLQGHNHVSHIMSLGTSDTSVLSSLIRFYHTVR